VPVIPASGSAPTPKATPPAPPAAGSIPDLPPLPAPTTPAVPPPLPEPVKDAKPDTPVSSPALPPASAPDLPDVGVPMVPMKAAPASEVPPSPPAKPMPLTTPPAPPADPLPKPTAADVAAAPPAGITYPGKPAANPPAPPTIEPASKVSPPSTGGPSYTGPTGEPTVGATAPAGGPGPATPPATTVSPDLPAFDPPMQAVIGTAKAAPAAVQLATKFRILLRVGEGEPTFEVRCGDDLVLKVACEKVDVKSPEKGSGLAAVRASGKVRFAGFGAEGTCDELSFLAGTGEVMMTGAVNVRVKDKLGRVESELTTATMKYKIDASAVGGALKP
jgi:hypothetical protein